MPRQTLDIKDFKYGVISSVDEEDIPSESASDSLNVDGDVGEGILRGIPADSQYLIDSDLDAAADDALVDVRLGKFIEDSGTYYLIYHDSNANKIIGIKDFYGALPTKEDLVTSNVSDNTTMVVNNKEVHIGTGNASTNIPKWVGKISHKQFAITSYNDIFEAAGATLDDATGTISGYTGLQIVTYDVEITATGANDTFKWRKAGGTYTTGVSIANTSAIALSDGVTITFAATTGHTIGDKWHITTDGLYVTNAGCASVYGTSAGQFSLALGSPSAGSGYFQVGKFYEWRFTAIYDGYQESLLMENSYDDIPAAETTYYPITITADSAAVSPASFDRRLTGINLYRADSFDGTLSGRGLFRMVASIDINDAFWTTSTADKVLVLNDYGTYVTINSVQIASPNTTYEENSGIPETLTSNIVNYCLSTKGNGYLFTGKNYHSKIPDANRYIYRSKYLRYDIFDWTNDFLIMPEPMTAMEFYDGKLWVFSNNKAYRVNPEGMYIEDELDNVGAQGQRSVHCNESGMFVGNKLNAWMYQGGTFYPIGDAIRQSASGGKSWQTFLIASSPSTATLTDLIVTSDSKKGYVLFINERTDTTAKLFAWAYNVIKKRWDAFSFAGYATSANAGAFKGKDGEVYLSNGTATYQLMRHSTNRQLWEWVSQEFSFGKTRQTKSLTMIKVDATGTVSITYGVDGATPATAGTSEALINTQIKNVRIKLNANAATSTNYVDSMEVIYRMLVGNR